MKSKRDVLFCCLPDQRLVYVRFLLRIQFVLTGICVYFFAYEMILTCTEKCDLISVLKLHLKCGRMLLFLVLMKPACAF